MNVNQMILSVIIVSYNIRYFLEQCLSSLKKSIQEGNLIGLVEVFIVDNASSDASMPFLISLYPEFTFIENKMNAGFAKANNQALCFCSGSFVLFLNPDTIIAEDTLSRCISFLQQTPDAGALGVHMIDGSGNYLKESKRGFPGLKAAFYKMSGLSNIFPRSKTIAGYYMGNLPENLSNPVDVLSGAFMMVRKNVLEKTGGFDEQFFMYGEDIDLSYRITQAGYRNYYLADTTIIHFKGESTDKNLPYLKMFYGAMKIFIKKHFTRGAGTLQWILLEPALRFHQGTAFIRLRLFSRKKSIQPSSIWVEAAQDSTELQNILVKIKTPLAETKSRAGEIIYCEGKQQTWKSIMTEMMELKDKYVFRFHGYKTHAIVSSSSSRSQGEVVII